MTIHVWISGLQVQFFDKVAPKYLKLDTSSSVLSAHGDAGSGAVCVLHHYFGIYLCYVPFHIAGSFNEFLSQVLQLSVIADHKVNIVCETQVAG